ncbi:MAG: chorismate synthase [Deltaproteobacteria bacterium RIFCSPLOWO2_12_FULL_44_12]|nr:MAG: chorismate synthase [Deltaproteobacteria bacterium RIFCSPHIGHO2_01_FULL_43_49]OGQ15843.1 MAG: chorismate synthase [Deltaproteobacteria bacterium RIFCSPHIGHO2_02_FULL_44_53]OGQ28797.1 MAG: chorismate synthase [Deltaproteobacteria bacterium RIFCSPHIGHO2_12_FULL_44_21]OGQ32117.1 MAG: chorismate synthase [Deltaproteobacteria bacterium RIFCSPLOWO2_01_FULL_45_74]OGQ43740.1 MAG: chorismate synthase [Deltaproteobacteria bacterium RIFCSPLOWO2_02_FULL_44_34]OGQ70445.1 MAG: chorismate synthase [D
MSNTLGKIFQITSFGESHGPCIGVVIDGCPSGLKIDQQKIAEDLARRRPGQSLTTPRQEKDEFKILSGVLNETTTGAPICMMIHNEDIQSKDYEERRFTPRPGHADYTAFVKYGGLEDYRGGGRFSARITAGFVMAGSVAKQLLKTIGVKVSARIIELGGVCQEQEIIRRLNEVQEKGNSVGGIIEGTALNLPVGLGEPVFDNLDGELAKALFALPAVKGVEFGTGFKAAKMLGSEHNDIFEMKDGKIQTKTNNAGGILGGLSNGMPLVVRVGFKPVSSIAKEQQTVNLETKETLQLQTKGRFDPCPIPRALPLVEAMIAIVLTDFSLRSQVLPRALTKR